jgi:hypothetical protein
VASAYKTYSIMAKKATKRPAEAIIKEISGPEASLAASPCRPRCHALWFIVLKWDAMLTTFPACTLFCSECVYVG